MIITPGCARLVARAARAAPAAVALLAALLAPAARAQEGAVGALTLRQAFEAAWQRQPEARGAPSRRQAAQAQLAAAGRLTAEPASLEMSNKTDRLTGNRGEREFEIGISAPLWLPGERDRTQAVAQAEAAALDGRLAAARWRVAGAVREAWWSAQRVAVDVQVAQAGLASAQRLAADVHRRVVAGDLARADQHQADGAVAAAVAGVAQARAEFTLASLAVQALTGQPVGNAAMPAAVAEPEPAAGAAAPGHVALREVQARAEHARRLRELASAQGRANPELSLSTTRSRGVAGEAYDQSLTLALRFPFGGGDGQRARLASADAERIEAEAALALEQAQRGVELAAAQARIGATRALVGAAQERARLAAETRGYFDKSFRLGETDLPTRLRVEQEALEAERQRERARIDLAHAISLWRQALGLLPD